MRGLAAALLAVLAGMRAGCASAPRVPEYCAELSSGYYVKLHSLKFPGGAIRGRLQPCGWARGLS